MNNNDYLNTKSNNNCTISETLWEHLQLKTSIEVIHSFAKAIFNTSSHKTISNYQISNSSLIQFFFGISLPLAERITFIIKGTREDFFIEEYQFVDLVELIYKGSIRSKIIFFFKLFDYQDNKILRKVNVVTLFMHINNNAIELIDDLFKDKEEMSFAEFLFKQKENMDLVLFFYFYLHQQRKVNDNILKVYNSLTQDVQPVSPRVDNNNNNNDIIKTNKAKLLQSKTLTHNNIQEQSDPHGLSSDIVNEVESGKEDSNFQSLRKQKNSFIGNLQAQEKEHTLRRQLTNLHSKGKNSIKQPLRHSKTTEILNTELIPKNTNKFYIVIEKTFGIDARNGSYLDMPKLIPRRREQSNISSISLLNDNFDDLNELDVFENDIKHSLSIYNGKNNNQFRFFENKQNIIINNLGNAVKSIKSGLSISISAITSGQFNKAIDAFNPKHTKSFQCFDEEINSKQKTLSVQMRRSIKKEKTISFKEINHQNIIPNDDFLTQRKCDLTNSSYTINNSQNNDELSLALKYSVYDSQFHFGMLFLIGQFVFFVCGKQKDKGQNKLYSLLIDKTFIKNDEKDLVQIILPFGEGQLYTFRFNSHQKANEFLLNIGFNNHFLETYSLTKEIGSGKFGAVWQGIKNNKQYAIKVLHKRGRYKLTLREVYINNFLINHKHKNIINVEEIYENADNVYIVMEYIDDGVVNENNIHNILEKCIHPKMSSENILAQIIDGVGFLHEHGIVHRDLKLDNILIKDISTLQIKLTDFGLATVINIDETISEKCGTMFYTAPEILNKNKYNRNIDLWSIGVISFYLHYRQFPITKFKYKDINSALIELKEIIVGINAVDIKENFLLHVISSCLIKSHMLRKSCQALLKYYNEYINNKTNISSS